MQLVGQHCLIDVTGVDVQWAKDASCIELLLQQISQVAEATIINSHFHTFGEGGGVTGVLLLAESHISIHTWPEHAYAALDIFMCGAHRIELAVNLLKHKLPAQQVQVTMLNRGMPSHISS